jgi:hypothetical protein
MRAEGVLKVILNVRVAAKLPVKLRDEKYIELLACENPPSLTKFLIKVGNPDVAKGLYDAICKVIPEEYLDLKKDDKKLEK